MKAIVGIALAASAMFLGSGCSDKPKTENAGVPIQKNTDPKAPGMMRPPSEGGPGIPKAMDNPKS
jgi:hypothetical protein